MYAVDKNIPIPADRRGKGRAKYPWRDMQVGDSFLVPKAINAISGTTSCAAKRLGFRFTLRTVEGGTRIWRIG